jgi:hypothetical protein
MSIGILRAAAFAVYGFLHLKMDPGKRAASKRILEEQLPKQAKVN